MGAPPSPLFPFFQEEKSMNAVSVIGQTMAMDGRSFVTPGSKVPQISAFAATVPVSAAEVTEYLADNLAKTKQTVQELQELSNMVLGHTLEFSVNTELDKVIVKVIDPETNKVIRQIPSEDLQKIQIQMKHAIGLLFDEMI